VLRRGLSADALLRFTVPETVPGWDPRKYSVDTLLAEAAAVLNDSRHPLVRAFGPLPTVAMVRQKPLVSAYYV
jgi:hypothetical protein